MTNWRDTPPTKAGIYYLRSKADQSEAAAMLDQNGTWRTPHVLMINGEWLVQFGNRLPTNDELAELRVLVNGLLYFAADVAAMPVDGAVAEYKAKINAILGVPNDRQAD